MLATIDRVASSLLAGLFGMVAFAVGLTDLSDATPALLAACLMHPDSSQAITRTTGISLTFGRRLVPAIALAFYSLAMLMYPGSTNSPKSVREAPAAVSEPARNMRVTSPAVLPVAEAPSDLEADRSAVRKFLGIFWSYKESRDTVSGGSIRQAILPSTNEIEFAFPYQGAQRARLTLRQHPRWGTDVMISIERGQFACSVADCTITLRFGNGDIETHAVNAPDSMETTLRFLAEPSQVVEKIRRSDRLKVEATFYQGGTKVFEFDTSGLKLE